MKFRQGFVSNSSSSSFVCAVWEETYDTDLKIRRFFREGYANVFKIALKESKFYVAIGDPDYNAGLIKYINEECSDLSGIYFSIFEN